MINENTTFKQYLKESGYSLMQYQEEVYNACIAKSKRYEKIDIYFQEEIEEGFNKNVPVDELAEELCKKFDYFKFGEDDDELEKAQTRAFVPFPESTEMEGKLVETSLRDLPKCKFAIRITPYKGNGIIKYATAPAHTSSIQKLKEMMENRLNMDLVEEVVVYPADKIELSDEPVSDLYESTETETKDDGMSDGETYTQWKENVFKYLDKRIETDKIKELGTYIKDFIKQEYDNGEPSWFNVAESVVNYARTNYPQAVKPRESNAFSITESLDGPATFTNELVNQFVRYVKKWFTSNTKYRVLMSDSVTKDGEHPYTHEKKKTYELTLRNTPVQTSLYLVVYSDYCYIAADGDRFSTKSYKFTSIQSLDKALNMLYDNIESVYGSLDEAFIQDDRSKVSITDLVDKIMTKAGLVVDMDDDYTAAAYYIADFYSKQSMPINGMVMWGSRDLLKFKRIYDEQIQNANTSEEIQEYEKKAVTNVRSIMLGNPGKKWVWIEEIKDEVRKERKDAEEKRRQAYLNSEEHRHMQDPGWRGPNGTWSND